MIVWNDRLVLQKRIDGWLLVGEVGAQRVHAGKESVYLILERRDLVGHCAELIRVLEAGGTAVGSIDALESEVAASLAWGLAVALDLSSFAFVASERQSRACMACVVCAVWHRKRAIPCYGNVAIALLLLLLVRVVALPLPRVATSAILH